MSPDPSLGLPLDTGAVPQVGRVCSRCVMDESAPRISFDADGICNFCRIHDDLDRSCPLDARGQRRLDAMVDAIRASGRGKPFDCVVGFSGGRDSTYLLYLAVRRWGLRPLAVHFNDGFDNPIAGENIRRAVNQLGVELRTVTSDWRESKDIRHAFLKASTPNLEVGTDLGYFAALYGVAARNDLRFVLTGHSFRTEGIGPLSWTYLDHRYLHAVHHRFGKEKLRGWKPDDPGFNLSLAHLFYYIVFRRIRAVTPLYLVDYVRPDAEKIIASELGWRDPGAHYFDDLYQSLISYVYRVKFGVDKRRFAYAALVRSGQRDRADALERLRHVHKIEDPKVIALCIKRLGLTTDEFAAILPGKPLTFRDYPNYLSFLRLFRPLIKIASRMHAVPFATYDRFFHCG